MTPLFQPFKHGVLNQVRLVEGIHSQSFERFGELHIFFGCCKGKIDADVKWYWHLSWLNGSVCGLQLSESWLISQWLAGKLQH